VISRTFFQCCLPSIGLVARCEGDICDAVALDRRKDRIDGRRHATIGTSHAGTLASTRTAAGSQ
jgi:enamine deaminase RidA (YjgF/YER057c/UK114 family)